MNQALFGLNQAVAQRSYNRVSGGGFRISRYAPRHLVKGAKRDAGLVGKRVELSEVVVLDGLANDVHRIHSRMLPTAGNKSNQRQKISTTENSLQNPAMDNFLLTTLPLIGNLAPVAAKHRCLLFHKSDLRHERRTNRQSTGKRRADQSAIFDGRPINAGDTEQ